MEWKDAVWILIFVVVVGLFLGPGMWSSSTNTLAKDIWLWWKRTRAQKVAGQGDAGHGNADPVADGPAKPEGPVKGTSADNPPES